MYVMRFFEPLFYGILANKSQYSQFSEAEDKISCMNII